MSFANLSRINEKAENSNQLNSQRIYVFQQRMRFLNFAAIISRSNIVFSTAKLVQFLKNSNSNHVTIANRVIAYLNDIKNLIIEFSEKCSKIFLCASDAAFADDELIRKSSNDYLFKLYDDFIDWRAVKQITMTTFCIETVLLILSRIAKKTIWWRRFFESIQYDSMKKLHIRCDNRQTLRVLKKEMLKLDTKLKHVNIHRHWLRQKVQAGRINVSWCSTAEMSVDDFIKVLPRQKHEKFLRQLHLIDITHLINQKNRTVWVSKCQTERICWMMRWSGLMISWDDEMSWWESESNATRKNFSFEKKCFWSDDLIIWSDQLNFTSLHHYSILHAWTIRLRIAFAYLRRFESSISSSICWFRIESSYDHLIEMIYSSRDDFFHVYWFSRSSRDQWARKWVCDSDEIRSKWHRCSRMTWSEEKFSWSLKISIHRWISMNHEMKDQ